MGQHTLISVTMPRYGVVNLSKEGYGLVLARSEVPYRFLSNIMWYIPYRVVWSSTANYDLKH